MSNLSLRVFVVTVITLAVAVPLAYGLDRGDCAPPLGCLYAQVCVAACESAWRQLPSVLLLAASVGLLPGGFGRWYVRVVEAKSPRTEVASLSKDLLGPLPFVVLGGFVEFLALPVLSAGGLAILIPLAVVSAALVSAAWSGREKRSRRFPA